MTTTPATPRSPSVTRPATVAGTSRCAPCANTDAAAQSAKSRASAPRAVARTRCGFDFARTRLGFDGFVFEWARVGMADSSPVRTKSEKGGSREADFEIKRAARLRVRLSSRTHARRVRLRRRAYNRSADARKPEHEFKVSSSKFKVDD